MIMSQSEEVQTKVLNALYWDLAVPPHRVKVEVENGWVTISGTVDLLSAHIMPNQTRAGLLACSASTIIFGSRRRTRSKGPPPTRVRDRAVGSRDIQSNMTLGSYCARLAI